MIVLENLIYNLIGKKRLLLLNKIYLITRI